MGCPVCAPALLGPQTYALDTLKKCITQVRLDRLTKQLAQFVDIFAQARIYLRHGHSLLISW
jgi:hypothetical protein